jgi:hypothetical protein
MHRRPVILLLVIAAGAAAFACGKSETAGSAASTTATTPAASTAAKTPFGVLNTPTEGQAVQTLTDKPFFASGWALADSGVANVSAVFDDGQKAYVKTGFVFPGVKDQFPTYADADRAGYMFGIPKLSTGQHSVVVTVKAKDGTEARVERHFTIP